jgi:hypothetical protein
LAAVWGVRCGFYIEASCEDKNICSNLTSTQNISACGPSMNAAAIHTSALSVDVVVHDGSIRRWVGLTCYTPPTSDFSKLTCK